MFIVVEQTIYMWLDDISVEMPTVPQVPVLIFKPKPNREGVSRFRFGTAGFLVVFNDFSRFQTAGFQRFRMISVPKFWNLNRITVRKVTVLVQFKSHGSSLKP